MKYNSDSVNENQRQFNNLPEEIRTIAGWVNWKLELRDDRLTKVPLNPFGGPAKSNDSRTWSNYSTAVANYVQKARHKVIKGIGWVVQPGFIGVDLDNCRDPETGVIDPIAWLWINSLQSYTEISPSGKGLRIICRGVMNGVDRRNNKAGFTIEAYDHTSPRFLTLTGLPIKGTSKTINDAQAAFDRLHGLYIARPKAKAAPASPTNLDSHEVLERARDAANGLKFAALFDDGDWQSWGYPSQSEADAALCCLIWFWCGDRDTVETLFERSALNRAKFDRGDYREKLFGVYSHGPTVRTIAFAGSADEYSEWHEQIENNDTKFKEFMEETE